MIDDREEAVDIAEKFIHQMRAISSDPKEMAMMLTAISVYGGEILVRAAFAEDIPIEVLRDRLVSSLDISIARGRKLYEH